jgi:hypothetical protein
MHIVILNWILGVEWKSVGAECVVVRLCLLYLAATSILKMTEDVLVKLNPGLLRQKLHLTRRGLFLLAKWTWN